MRPDNRHSEEEEGTAPSSATRYTTPALEAYSVLKVVEARYTMDSLEAH